MTMLAAELSRQDRVAMLAAEVSRQDRVAMLAAEVSRLNKAGWQCWQQRSPDLTRQGGSVGSRGLQT